MYKSLIITTGLLLAACETPEPETIIIKETETVTIEEMKSNCVGSINGIKFAERFWNTGLDGKPISTLDIQIDACEKKWYAVQLDLILHIKQERREVSFDEMGAFGRPIKINQVVEGVEYGDLAAVEYVMVLTDWEGEQTQYQGGRYLPFVVPPTTGE